jgi:hypothetical protein
VDRAYLGTFQVNENVMVIVYRVRISIRAATSSLEILSTHETAIDVDVGGRYGADFLKVKVKSLSVNLRHVNHTVHCHES